MADERLRALERAARADPSDAVAGLALARALLQAGERRRALFEYSRLARVGDPEALVAVDGWQRRSHGDVQAPVPCAPLRLPARRRERPVVSRALPALLGGDDLLVVHAQQSLLALDAHLEPRWERRGQVRCAALRGDDVLAVEVQELVLLDGGTGAELDRAPLAPWTRELLTWGDRAFASHPVSMSEESDMDQVRGLDVGERFGQELWSRPAGSFSHRLRRCGPHLVAVQADELALWDPASGHDVASRRFVPLGRHARRHEQVSDLDARGAVAVETGLGDDPVTVTEYELPGLAPRWAQELRGVRDVTAFVQGDLALLRLRPPGDPERLRAVDRATGRTLAEEELPGELCRAPLRAGSTLYVATFDEEERPRLCLLDATTLARRGALDVDPTLFHLDLLAVEGGLVATCTRSTGASVVRFDYDPRP